VGEAWLGVLCRTISNAVAAVIRAAGERLARVFFRLRLRVNRDVAGLTLAQRLSRSALATQSDTQ
jgi:hypothetical protein